MTWPTILKELNHYMHDGCVLFHIESEWFHTSGIQEHNVALHNQSCSVTPDLPNVRFHHQGRAAPTPPESSTQLGCSCKHHWTLLLFHRCRGEGKMEHVKHKINQFPKWSSRTGWQGTVSVSQDLLCAHKDPAATQCSSSCCCLHLVLTWKCAKLNIKNSV